MAEKNNAVCKICGNEYYVCLSCSDAMKLHPWKIYTDNSNCFQIFQVVRGFSTGVYTKDEAREKLQNVDLKNIESLRPHIRDIVKDILKKENPVTNPVDTETVSTEIAEIENNVVVENIKKVEEPEDIIKTTYSRKRNFKVEE